MGVIPQPGKRIRAHHRRIHPEAAGGGWEISWVEPPFGWENHPTLQGLAILPAAWGLRNPVWQHQQEGAQKALEPRSPQLLEALEAPCDLNKGCTCLGSILLPVTVDGDGSVEDLVQK